jgi:LacI family transcriptional regulator
MVTMRDIAKKADVSVGTVSRVLNSDTTLQISPKTRERILAIAEKNNYTNQRDKSQSKKGKIIITGWYTKKVKISDLYFRSLRWNIEMTLKNQNYEIIRTFFNEQDLDVKGADGIIAIGHFDQKSLEQLQEAKIPLVIVNQDTLSYEISCVTADYFTPVQKIIEHFLKNKFTKIGMIEATSKSEINASPDPRAQAFRNIMIAKGLLDEEFIFSGDFSTESGYQLMKSAIRKFPSALPSAFFVCSDTMAIGAMKALQEEQIRIPEDVSIVGFGDLEVGRYLTPSLSTVQLATQQMGTSAANLLLNQINGLQTYPVNIVTATKLLFRESSK